MRRAVRAALIAAAMAATRASAQDTTVFVDVSVIPMTSPGVLAHRNVTVARGVIVAVDSARVVEQRSTVRVVVGQGRYLVPGLTDAHVHLELNERRWMPAFLAYGVTTVFNLRGEPRHAALRADISVGRATGPTVYTSGPYLNLPGIQSADDASRAVGEQKNSDYDFIKIHGNLAPDAYRALTRDAQRLGIPVIGHAPRNLPFDSLIATRQTMVAHAEEILYTHFRRPDTTGVGALGPRMRDAGVWLTPNLSAYTLIARQIGRPSVIDSMLSFADARVLDSAMFRYWRSGAYTNRPLETAPGYDNNRRFLVTVVGSLHRSGVMMLAGTDSPLPGLYPGRSLHDELDLLVSAGLSRFDALATATINAGRFVGQHVRPGTRFGGVAAGMRADLVLVDRNPLDDLSVLRTPVGVMAAGRWFDRRSLERLVAQ